MIQKFTALNITELELLSSCETGDQIATELQKNRVAGLCQDQSFGVIRAYVGFGRTAGLRTNSSKRPLGAQNELLDAGKGNVN